LIVVSVCLSQGSQTVVFEGARLITGDGSAPIEIALPNMGPGAELDRAAMRKEFLQ